VKAIFFNAKGVLYDRPAPDHYLQLFLEAHGLQLPSRDVLKKISPALKDQITRGRLVEGIYADAVLKACGVTSPVLFYEGEKAIQRDRANIVLFPDAIPTLGSLKERGFKLGIITDTIVPREEKIAWMKSCGLDIEWDAYVNSLELGTRKPDPLMYQEAMRRAGVVASGSVYVGRKKQELAGAKHEGMTTIAFNYAAGVEADVYLQKLSDLLELPFLLTVA
jgi:FMN phosphatase YigB (HAD superfamily)